MDFPTLFKTNKAGKIQTWNIHVVKQSDALSLIVRKYGLEGGALTESVKEITRGKNVGKSNETSVFEQACAEARSVFKKQSETYSTTTTTPKPMLAHTFDKQSHKIRYPAFAQPKLDGVRMIARCHNNKVTCLSRTGKEYFSDSLQHVCAALLKLGVDSSDVWFDGELYSDSLTFEEIVGVCRNTLRPDPEVYKKLEYHVYDLILPDLSQTDRLARLTKLVPSQQQGVVQRVPTTTVRSKEEVHSRHDEFVEAGYEGIMVRNELGLYAQNRSYDLQKFKNFQDREFVITDVKEAVGNDKGTAILRCQTDDLKPFWVRPRGSRAYRTSLLESQVVDKLLTVRFQNWTERGVPRFPVGLTIRDYE